MDGGWTAAAVEQMMMLDEWWKCEWMMWMDEGRMGDDEWCLDGGTDE
jgi:hypothetical protein